jgi:PAS domain S-box-containing protein
MAALGGSLSSDADLLALLSGLLGETPLGVSVLDRDRVFVYVNAAMADLHGVPLSEHAGRPLGEVLPVVDGAVSAALARALDHGAVTSEIAVTGHPRDESGEPGHWRLSVSPIRGADGAIAGVSMVARDVTSDVSAQRARATARNRMLSLLSQQRDIAVGLQRALLPTPFRHPAFATAARYVPGTQQLQVGGDWYDQVLLADGRIGIVVGDVMGKGLRAAALMGQLRAGLRAYTRLDMDPGTVLGHLDELLRDLDDAAIATCLYGVFDPDNHALTVASAGHLPPILLEGGEAAPVEIPVGPPLGAGGEHGQRTLTLPPGSTLALYTDGLVEDRTRAIDDGLAQLAAALAAGPADLEQLADSLLRAMGRDNGHDDDVALLLVRPTAS